MKWKDRLLSSSLPLEYEVGKILVQKNFYVDYDYSYQRLDNNEEKEFSIDLLVGGYYPFELDSSIQLKLDLLIECKYRNPNVSWLFIKDINISNYSNFSSKGVIKVIDEFSDKTNKNRFVGFDYPDCERCIKGIEVNTQNGEVHENGIVHGKSQLTYAMPSLIHRHINFSLNGHLEDVYPYIICPILLTTSDLRILNDDFSIENLNNANSIDDISTEVPFIKLYSDIYPSFQEHCANIFEDLPKGKQFERFEYFKDLRNENPTPKCFHSSPDIFLNELKNGYGDIFREIIVCNLKNFPELLVQVQSGIELVGKGLEKINKKL